MPDAISTETKTLLNDLTRKKAWSYYIKWRPVWGYKVDGPNSITTVQGEQQLIGGEWVFTEIDPTQYSVLEESEFLKIYKATTITDGKKDEILSFCINARYVFFH